MKTDGCYLKTVGALPFTKSTSVTKINVCLERKPFPLPKRLLVRSAKSKMVLFSAMNAPETMLTAYLMFVATLSGKEVCIKSRVTIPTHFSTHVPIARSKHPISFG